MNLSAHRRRAENIHLPSFSHSSVASDFKLITIPPNLLVYQKSLHMNIASFTEALWIKHKQSSSCIRDFQILSLHIHSCQPEVLEKPREILDLQRQIHLSHELLARKIRIMFVEDTLLYAYMNRNFRCNVSLKRFRELFEQDRCFTNASQLASGNGRARII
jgi:hypothetical protein